MPLPPPAVAGMPLAEVDTPALLLDLDRFERNVDNDGGGCTRASALRPHAKSHKCAEIAKRQIAAGAVGVCCQKVSEAQAMVDGGVADVLVSNEVVGRAKLARLAELAQARHASASASTMRRMPASWTTRRVRPVCGSTCWSRSNVGANRCGVEPGEPGVAARARRRRLRQTCASRACTRTTAPRSTCARWRSAARRLRRRPSGRGARATLIEDEGLECEVVTGAGTGTFLLRAGERRL